MNSGPRVKDETLSWFLEHWHTVVFVAGAVVVGIVLVVRDVVPLILALTGSHLTEKRDPDAVAVEILLVTVNLVLLTLAVRVVHLDRKVASVTGESDLERFRTLRRRLDPNLEKVYGEYVERQLANVVTAVESGKIILNDFDEIRLMYKRLLANFPNSEFWSVSVPSREYLWGDSSVMQAVDDFINKHNGRMRRVFFLTTDEPVDDDRTVMERQVRMKIEVYYIPLRYVPRDLNQLYLLDAQARMAWIIEIDAARRITQVRATIDRREIDSYREAFQRLLELDATRRFPQPA